MNSTLGSVVPLAMFTYMADPLHLYYAPDLASNLFQFFEDSQQILGKYNLIV